LIAVSLAIFYPQALGWIVASFAYSVSALLVPILGGFILREKNILDHKAGIVSILAGISGSAIAHFMGSDLYVMYGLIASALGLIIMVFVNKSTKENEHELSKNN